MEKLNNISITVLCSLIGFGVHMILNFFLFFSCLDPSNLSLPLMMKFAILSPIMAIPGHMAVLFWKIIKNITAPSPPLKDWIAIPLLIWSIFIALSVYIKSMENFNGDPGTIASPTFPHSLWCYATLFHTIDGARRGARTVAPRLRLFLFQKESGDHRRGRRAKLFFFLFGAILICRLWLNVRSGGDQERGCWVRLCCSIASHWARLVLLRILVSHEESLLWWWMPLLLGGFEKMMNSSVIVQLDVYPWLLRLRRGTMLQASSIVFMQILFRLIAAGVLNYAATMLMVPFAVVLARRRIHLGPACNCLLNLAALI